MNSRQGAALFTRLGFTLVVPLAAAALLVSGASGARPSTSPRSAQDARAAESKETTHQTGIRSSVAASATLRATTAITTYVYLPLVANTRCDLIPSETYGTFPTIDPATGVDMSTHPDVNLAVRGYILTSQFKGLVDYGGVQDPKAPQLYTLFTDERTPEFRNVYQVYNWNWGTNQRGSPIANPPVTFAGFTITQGETIHVPDSQYDIGSGYEVLVLYATPHQLTLKYTGEDNVIAGYTLHLENVCVEPRLLALYQQMNAAGRYQLPALRGDQAIGQAIGDELGVAIRDTGAFMDPRARQSWWIGR